MPNHSMSCFKLPISLCKRIQSALTRFYWDSKPDERKMAWISSPECLLARVLRGKYFPDADFLQISAPTSCSHGWRGILIGRDLIKDHVGWAIGNGEDINVWNELWLSTSEWEAPIAPPPSSSDSAFIKVASLLLPNERDWDAGIIRQLLPHLTPVGCEMSGSWRSLLSSKCSCGR